MLVNKIDLTKFSGIRKYSYGDGITEIFVLSNTNQRDNLLDIYEELSFVINSCMCTYYYFGIHGGPIKNLFYACFFLSRISIT